MTSDPRAALAAVLDDRGPVAPLLALQYAADWAARTVLKEACADDMAAFECVVALDDALPPVRELMSQAPELVKLASAGSAVGDRLAASAAELAREREALAAERAGLESARELLSRLAEVEAERERLRHEIGRAERAALIERELPALRRTLAELTAATAAGDAAEADAVVHGLIAAGRRLAELTEEQQSILDDGNDRLAARVADATAAAGQALARHAELAAELEAREREAAELRAAEEEILPGLRARRQADAELTEALAASQQAGAPAGHQPAAPAGHQPAAPPGLERVRAELAELGERVDQAESLLRPLLRRHQQAYEEASKVRGPAGDLLS